MATTLERPVLASSNISAESQHSSVGQSQQQSRIAVLDYMEHFRSREHLARNLLCVTATPQLARLFSLYEIYRRLVAVSGDILEFGVWYGQNMIMLENLRALLEPFNFRRSIVGFDAFKPLGDVSDEINRDYFLDPSYGAKIETLLQQHEHSNIGGENHRGKHKVLVGDISDTLPAYRREGRVIAAMLVDVPNQRALEDIFTCAEDQMASGGVIVLDDLNSTDQPWVSRSFLPHKSRYDVYPCPFMPSRSIAVRNGGAAQL